MSGILEAVSGEQLDNCMEDGKTERVQETQSTSSLKYFQKSIDAGIKNPIKNPILPRPNPHPPKPYQIDYTKLEEDLIQEVKADELYWIRNAAKLRAVQQHGTYEEFRGDDDLDDLMVVNGHVKLMPKGKILLFLFSTRKHTMRQIVHGAHLKPLKPGEAALLRNEALNSRSVWNALANKAASTGNSSSKFWDRNTSMTFELPSTAADFTRAWKGFEDLESKTNFLRYIYNSSRGSGNMTHSTMANFFGEEVPPDIFPEIIEGFSNIVLDPDEIEFILQTLLMISETKRFNITLVFLTSKDVNQLKSILARLEQNLSEALETKHDVQEKPTNLLLKTVRARYKLA